MGPGSQPAAKVEAFRALHVPGRPVLMPNPWDAGSAKLLASLGFQALATTSSGHAATLGRLDGCVDLLLVGKVGGARAGHWNQSGTNGHCAHT